MGTCQKTDTEDPTCARISFSGKFIDVTTYGDAKEERFALDALYSRHPTMEGWGQPGKGDHDFHVWKLEIDSIFFLDFCAPRIFVLFVTPPQVSLLMKTVAFGADGGGKPLTPKNYFGAKP